MLIVSVVGARPNVMKLAPVERELARRPDVEHVVVHTGQHYDPEMSEAFFQDLWIPRPQHNLGVGSGTHAQQTAAVMLRIEPILQLVRPDVVVVYGDVNSTVAAALVAAKLGIRVAHVEAGLRSRDWSMPEEINRVLTDRIADLLFAPSPDAVQNLIAEGTPRERVHFVGNVMIDSLCWALPQARTLDTVTRHGVEGTPFVVVTLHRPATVDNPAALREMLDTLVALGEDCPVLFPVHPRTRERIHDTGFPAEGRGGLRLLDPMGYVEMLGLVASARLVLTDSGGLQEETSYLGVPCLTVRQNTERPITCQLGTNRLVAPQREVVLAAARQALEHPLAHRPVIERWDGKAAQRIAASLCDGARFDLDAPARSRAPETSTRRVSEPISAAELVPTETAA
ncbi:MAG: UDP-N-acetylglucosamine 2-epimerase (non-hydrolyzing) [Gemmatimonadetes bacterium]|nr:UDP-N-acetylglucosamine 2-epimerase (non-hydrolyzing) [Gemmatimonadota bacterium]